MSSLNPDKKQLSKIATFLLDNPILRALEPNKKNFPETVYKYRKWNDEFQKKLLTDNELYMSPAELFNDPFDCKIYKNYSLLDTPEKINKHIDKCVEDAKDWMLENNKNADEQRKILEERISDLIKYQVRSDYYDDKMFNNNYGIACFSKRWNSILMWSHYADNHKGYCIGFDEKRLRYSMIFGNCDYVTYADVFPEIHPDDNSKEIRDYRTYYKSKEWEYEEEYRLVNLFSGKDFPKDAPERVIKLDDKFIVEVILGICMPDDDKKQIIEICKKRKIPVYEAVKVPFKFEIEKFIIE